MRSYMKGLFNSNLKIWLIIYPEWTNELNLDKIQCEEWTLLYALRQLPNYEELPIEFPSMKFRKAFIACFNEMDIGIFCDIKSKLLK